MAELTFWTGTMDAGKSTLALQTNHNHAARGRVGLIFTSHDRAGEAVVSSRLGLTHDALEVTADFSFWQYVVDRLTQGGRIDYLVCDEAQFYTPHQVDDLAKIADELQIDVFCFGILTDFRTSLFPGSARLVELADRTEVLQVEALCWCGGARPTTRGPRTASWSPRATSWWWATSRRSRRRSDVPATRPARSRWWPTRCCAASTTAAA